MKIRRQCKCGCGEITDPGKKYIPGHLRQRKVWIGLGRPRECWEVFRCDKCKGYHISYFFYTDGIGRRIVWDASVEIPKRIAENEKNNY